MRNLTKALSSLISQPDGEGGDRFPGQSLKTPMFQSKQQAKTKNKAFVSISNGLIWVHPRAAVPIRLFLWGGALPRTASCHVYISPCRSTAISPCSPRPCYPLKLSRAEPGQYLDGRPPGKSRLLLDEVLVRTAGGAHPVVCVGPNASV